MNALYQIEEQEGIAELQCVFPETVEGNSALELAINNYAELGLATKTLRYPDSWPMDAVAKKITITL